MKNKFAETLKELRIKAGFTQKQVYEMLGIPQSTFSSWEIGKAEPSATMTLKLCELYRVDDILGAFGYDGYNEAGSLILNLYETELIKKYRSLDQYGKELIDIILQKEFNRSAAAKVSEPAPAVEKRLINYYYRLASAGTGQIVFDMPPTKRIEIPCTPENRRVDYAIGVNGSSMEPLYFDDDILLVEMTDSLQLGEIGIFFVDGESYVKKLGEHELISLNKNYPNKPLSESAKCLGRVVGKL